MKVCPKCGNEYQDERQNFCLSDGSPLIDGASLPTIPRVALHDNEAVMTTPQVARPTAPARRSRSNVPLIILAVIGVIAVIGISSFFLAAMMRRGEQLKANQNAQKNAATSNSRPSTRTASSPEANSDIKTASRPDAEDPPIVADTDAPTPITWTTTAGTFDPAPGKVYRFECPPEGTTAIIWGSDVYTTDSSICTAAVHAGKITTASGGEVTIKLGGGRETYGATTRNGVTSHNYGKFPYSFVFVGGSAPAK